MTTPSAPSGDHGGLRALADAIEDEVRRLHAPPNMNRHAAAGWEIGMARWRARYAARACAGRGGGGGPMNAQPHGDANESPDTTTQRHPTVTLNPVENPRKRHRKRHQSTEKASPPGDAPPYVHPTVTTACGSVPLTTRALDDQFGTAIA
jgi:hypothetical protein